MLGHPKQLQGRGIEGVDAALAVDFFAALPHQWDG